MEGELKRVRYFIQVAVAMTAVVIPTPPPDPHHVLLGSAPLPPVQVQALKSIVAVDNDGDVWELQGTEWTQLPLHPDQVLG